MDLLRLYLVNILRPVVEDPKLHEQDDEDEDDEEDEEEEDEEMVAVNTGDSSEKARSSKEGQRSAALGTRKPRKSSKSTKNERRSFKNIELLDPSGPKLIHGIQRWFVLYQIIGQLNWLGKPLILSIIYKSILIPTCVYIGYKDILKSMSASKITDEFKNPIFVFISLSATATLILLATLTMYNNLFNWCPLFKVLTTERLCFVRREVQDIIGNNTLPPILCFYAFNCVLLRMLTTKNFQEFINNFDLIDYVRDLFVFLCVGYHLIGMCYTDFYIRICFGVWIIAMKTNLENRFAYLQKHQRVKQRSSLRERSSRGTIVPPDRVLLSNRKATSSSMMSNFSASTVASSIKNDHDLSQADFQDGQFEVLSQDSIATAHTINTTTNGPTSGDGAGIAPVRHGEPSAPSRIDSFADRMTIADFKAKYKIETMDEIQKNLNTMDDHLEVSRDFQNSSLVLITLSAFLTNGALLLLAYNLLANQGDYYHGFIIVLIAASYTLTIFMCYIGDSWLLYSLESFVQTVEDEYFLQSASDDVDHEIERSQQHQHQHYHREQVTRSTTGGSDANTTNQDAADLVATTTTAQQQPDWSPSTPAVVSETGSESMPYSELIRQHHQLFIIKKRDVLFCREFLNQFQNHLATPWSKLTVKVQLHMLRTFVTLIAAQIIFDREH